MTPPARHYRECGPRYRGSPRLLRYSRRPHYRADLYIEGIIGLFHQGVFLSHQILVFHVRINSLWHCIRL